MPQNYLLDEMFEESTNRGIQMGIKQGIEQGIERGVKNTQITYTDKEGQTQTVTYHLR